MCYDIAYMISLESIEDYFGDLIFDDPQIEINFTPMDHMQGVAVFGKHPIIYENRDDNKLHCKLMEWGIIRFFEKTEPNMVNRNKMLNIRAERILDDPASYWYKIRNRRCIIPLSHAFEHRAIVGWKNKVPYAIRPKESIRQKGDGIFGLPGLYSVAEIVDKNTGELVKRWTFGMITRAANPIMRNIHNNGESAFRMPLFLPYDKLIQFVRNDLAESEFRDILSYEIASEDLEYWPVWTIRTPKGRPDEKSKVDYFEWAGLLPLGEGNPEVKITE